MKQDNEENEIITKEDWETIKKGDYLYYRNKIYPSKKGFGAFINVYFHYFKPKTESYVVVININTKQVFKIKIHKYTFIHKKHIPKETNSSLIRNFINEFKLID